MVQREKCKECVKAEVEVTRAFRNGDPQTQGKLSVIILQFEEEWLHDWAEGHGLMAIAGTSPVRPVCLASLGPAWAIFRSPSRRGIL